MAWQAHIALDTPLSPLNISLSRPSLFNNNSRPVRLNCFSMRSFDSSAWQSKFGRQNHPLRALMSYNNNTFRIERCYEPSSIAAGLTRGLTAVSGVSKSDDQYAHAKGLNMLPRLGFPCSSEVSRHHSQVPSAVMFGWRQIPFPHFD